MPDIYYFAQGIMYEKNCCEYALILTWCKQNVNTNHFYIINFIKTLLIFAAALPLYNFTLQWYNNIII